MGLRYGVLTALKKIPIFGQYFSCRSQHYSAALLEFGFICLASSLPILAVTLIETASGLITDFHTWSKRFSPELAIASSCVIAPMMYFFVTPSRPNISGERTDYPHKGSLQLACLAIFALGMLLYTILSCLKFFQPSFAAAASETLYGFGPVLYAPSLFLAYTALLFRHFSDDPVLEGPDTEVPGLLHELEGRV